MAALAWCGVRRPSVAADQSRRSRWITSPARCWPAMRRRPEPRIPEPASSSRAPKRPTRNREPNPLAQFGPARPMRPARRIGSPWPGAGTPPRKAAPRTRVARQKFSSPPCTAIEKGASHQNNPSARTVKENWPGGYAMRTSASVTVLFLSSFLVSGFALAQQPETPPAPTRPRPLLFSRTVRRSSPIRRARESVRVLKTPALSETGQHSAMRIARVWTACVSSIWDA